MILDIQIALEERLKGLAAEPEVAWEGRVYRPVVGKPYLAASMASRGGRPDAIGANAPTMWSGTYRVMVVNPTTDGLRTALRRADRVRAHFKRGLALAHGAAKVTVFWADIGTAYPTTDWLNLPVDIAWYAEELPHV